MSDILQIVFTIILVFNGLEMLFSFSDTHCNRKMIRPEVLLIPGNIVGCWLKEPLWKE